MRLTGGLPKGAHPRTWIRLGKNAAGDVRAELAPGDHVDPVEVGVAEAAKSLANLVELAAKLTHDTFVLVHVVADLVHCTGALIKFLPETGDLISLHVHTVNQGKKIPRCSQAGIRHDGRHRRRVRSVEDVEVRPW